MDGVPVTLAEAWVERGPAPILPKGRIPPEYLGSEKIETRLVFDLATGEI